jgi:tetratricopeptide (TPR) repeat protein
MRGPGEVRNFAAADAASFLGTFALVSLAIAVLFALDTLLAGLDRAERRGDARHFYQEGIDFAAAGHWLDAVDRFRNAVSSERSNPVYQRALAATLSSAGKPVEAEAVVADRLQHDPADGEASLIMAQALALEGQLAPAISYYHRAVYGHWDRDPEKNRIRARFELVDVLARHDLQAQLLAELLPLEREAPDDVATRRRIARLFTAAGSPSHAAQIFRDILRRDRRDADAYLGLGLAEFERANYRTALADLIQAARLDPDNAEIAAGLALCNEVLGLDPTQRGLPLTEQYRRSQVLLWKTLQVSDSCAAAVPAGAVRALADSARMLQRKSSGSRAGYRAVEPYLDLAEALWQARRRECPSPVSRAERPLVLVLDKIAQ